MGCERASWEDNFIVSDGTTVLVVLRGFRGYRLSPR